MNKKTKKEYPKLEKVEGSDYCQFSIVENKMKQLYRNQQKIYDVLIDFHERMYGGWKKQ